MPTTLQTLLTCLLLLCFGNVGESGPPNLLLITVDNLGYGDLSVYNPDSIIRTPCIGNLATQGARLTNFYTASPTCTVSRACLLTGRIPQRHGLLEQLAGVEGNYGAGLSQQEILLPQILQSAPIPYATACFGKWNIGFAAGSRPTERGFEEFLGHASGNIDHYHHHYREKLDLHQGIVPLDREGEYATDIFADAAIDFLHRQGTTTRPWFCYLPFNAPHFPVASNKLPGQTVEWQAPDWAFQEYGWSPDEADPHRRYAAVVFALDRAIGRVLAMLDETGAAENTLVFLMSDNGAFRLGREGLDVGSNKPLRSGGVTCWEGGLRVPAFARWPGHIDAGIVINQPCWSPDLLVTAAALAGAKLPADRTFDGQDIREILTERGPTPQRSFYFNYKNHAALRQGNLKIVRENPRDPWQLFDLAKDISETNNLANKNPRAVNRMAASFNRWTDSSTEPGPIDRSQP